METSSSSSSGSGSITPTKRRLSEADEDYREEDEAVSDAGSESENEETQEYVKRKETKQPDMARDAKAAYMLMKLHMADATLKEDVLKGKRRRASA